MTLTAPRAPSARKPKGAGGERREEILVTALKLFGERGLPSVSTRQIADAVGISQPSLYAYFPTKQALTEEVSRRAFQALSAAMLGVLQRVHGEAALAPLARVYIDFGLDQPDAYRIAFMVEGPDRKPPDHPPTGAEAFRLYRGAIAEAMGADSEEEAIDLVAQSLWASLHGLVSLMIARPHFRWADRQKLIDLHIRRLFPLR
jgi:AcrR family transcriptional regulator